MALQLTLHEQLSGNIKAVACMYIVHVVQKIEVQGGAKSTKKLSSVPGQT